MLWVPNSYNMDFLEKLLVNVTNILGSSEDAVMVTEAKESVALDEKSFIMNESSKVLQVQENIQLLDLKSNFGSNLRNKSIKFEAEALTKIQRGRSLRNKKFIFSSKRIKTEIATTKCRLMNELRARDYVVLMFRHNEYELIKLNHDVRESQDELR
jgi:hypothetical protein